MQNFPWLFLWQFKTDFEAVVLVEYLKTNINVSAKIVDDDGPCVYCYRGDKIALIVQEIVENYTRK